MKPSKLGTILWLISDKLDEDTVIRYSPTPSPNSNEKGRYFVMEGATNDSLITPLVIVGASEDGEQVKVRFILENAEGDPLSSSPKFLYIIGNIEDKVHIDVVLHRVVTFLKTGMPFQK